MRKHIIALVAGIASFPLLMLLGEGIGDAAGWVFTAIYYFVCQFFLSRGHERAYGDWSVMLTLDASSLVLILLNLAQGGPGFRGNLAWLFCLLGGTFAGAIAAALAARSGRSGLWGSGPIPRPVVAGAGALVFGLVGFVVGEFAAGRSGPLPANVGFGLGAAFGAYFADHRQGRLGIV